uniref:Uncharacterized protein n=1 Tax=Anopheles minimus TaxID=112268 RepID=A0A182WPL2_9DIPT
MCPKHRSVKPILRCDCGVYPAKDKAPPNPGKHANPFRNIQLPCTGTAFFHHSTHHTHAAADNRGYK